VNRTRGRERSGPDVSECGPEAGLRSEKNSFSALRGDSVSDFEILNSARKGIRLLTDRL